jgi:Ca2+-binding RTX toxin-like protein
LIPGLEIPLLEDPSEIVGLLFNQVYDPVTLVTYDLPELSVSGGFSLQIPILGPIALKFTGDAGASIDLKIGYDTKAFEEAVGGAPFAFEDGFFFDATKPLASLTAELTASAGVDALVLSAWATGGIHFAISASLDNKDGDGKVRLGELGGCFVDPITGNAWADVTVDIEIDFGLFSVSESIPIASVTLAEFDLFECPPPRMPTSPPNQGLATLGGLGVPTELVLNVGDRASERVITEDGESKQIPGENEFYFIGLAREPATNEGPFPSTQVPGAIIPDAIDVSAFGYTQRYGSAAAPVTSIRANFGSQNDSLVIAEEITLDARISGGGGNDVMLGGNERDFFNGDEGDDYLVGNNGADVLEGGDGDDTLDGGENADTLRGGKGRDKVTYENANKDTGEGVEIYVFDGKLIATGGDAFGDSLESIEYLVGTNFNDTLYANPLIDDVSEPSLHNTVEGRDGNDIIYGAEGKDDFLIGGRGGDTIDGKSGDTRGGKSENDATTYVGSLGGVYIDLAGRVFSGGDAEGDNLISIESVQGSSFNDAIYGDGSNNEIDGFVGDDWLSGGGGTDKVSGHLGNDTVFGFGDGDTLDGGGLLNDPAIDLLSYERVTSAGVTVNLATGVGSDSVAVAKVAVGDLTPIAAPGYSTFENLTGTDILEARDNLTGDRAGNIIRGLAGDDIINGGDGDDLLIGGTGGDTLDGGEGVDWADYQDSFETVRASLAAGVFGAGGTAEGDSLTQIENLRMSDFVDELRGNAGNNRLDPGLASRTKERPLFFGDFVVGGEGTDTLVVDYSRGDLGTGVVGGFAQGFANLGVLSRQQGTTDEVLDRVLFDEIEELQFIGTIKADKIYGGQGKDNIQTGNGNDIIVSGLGDDLVLAGDGDDVVTYGTDISQQLSAEAGSDQFTIKGGRGIDTLSVSLAALSLDIILTGTTPGVENRFANLALPNNAVITEFEILHTVHTGSGNDELTQLGRFNNTFHMGDGSDTITPGLGRDSVDGQADMNGLTLYTGNIYLASAAFYDASGDTLVLNYSALAAGTHVEGDTEAVFSGFQLRFQDDEFHIRYVDVATNNGSYTSVSSDPALNGLDNVTFFNIERLDVTGSNGNDFLVGTEAPFFPSQVRGNTTPRGDDILRGGAGRDFLHGLTGDDQLFGGDGNDFLIGAGFGDSSEVDVLTGGAGADLFELGDGLAPDYLDGDRQKSSPNRAVITDFNPFNPGEGDSIRLHGFASEYRTVVTGSSTLIYRMDGDIRDHDELVGEVQNFTGLDLNAGYMSYEVFDLGGGSGLTALTGDNASAVDEPAPAAAPSTQPSSPDVTQPAALAAATTPWVTQQNDPNELLETLGSAFGVVTTSASLTVEGNGDAFGVFDGDPFGLGSGIVLSTGKAADLAGPNTADGSLAPEESIALTFRPLGIFNSSNVYVADLTGLGIDLKSLTLRDSNSHQGGGDGRISGFDLNAIIVSTTELKAGDSLDALNDPSLMPRLDVFDFSAAGTFLKPGTQRSPSSGADLYGTIQFGPDDAILDNGFANLSRFDNPIGTFGPRGFVTLGDGGEIGFNLTPEQGLSTDGPLYLYVAEAFAGTGEQLTGQISVSSNLIQPDGDLSSDLGAAGSAGDTTKLTYKFTPAAGSDTLTFEFVLFSEELPEFAGTFPTDTFKIKLNGVDYAALSDGSAATLNNLMITSPGPTHPDLILNPAGTGPASDLTRADAYTTVITFTGQVMPGVENVLEIDMADGRDAFLDSGILIRGITNNAPEITLGAEVTAVENTTAVATVTVTDPDPGQSLIYAIVGGADQNLFNIDSNTGALAFIVPPDFEQPNDAGADNVYDLVVRATDNGDPMLSDEQAIMVNVADGGDVPDITSGGTFSVTENTKAVGTVTASNPDAGQTVTYSIVGGADQSLFQINAGTGELSLVAAPDFEQPGDSGGDNVYDVVVEASDNGNPVLSDEQAIAVRVTNVAESFVPHGTGYFDEDHSGAYLLRRGDGTFFLEDVNSNQVTGHLVGAVGAEWRFIGNGDFNGNDVSDMLTVRDSDNMLHVHTMGSNQVVGAGFVGQVGGEWNILGIGDFNDDGTDDILSQRDGDGMLHVHQMNSTQVSGSAFLGQIGTEWNFLATGDFNNDGTSDLLWQHDSNGQVLIHNIQSNQVVGSAVVGQIGYEWHFAGSGDFDGDHTDDVLWQADNGTLLVYDINNNQATNAPMLETLPADMHVAGIGDFTGDGTDDLVLRHDDGSFQLQQIQNSAVTSTVNLGQVSNEWFII